MGTGWKFLLFLLLFTYKFKFNTKETEKKRNDKWRVDERERIVVKQEYS